MKELVLEAKEHGKNSYKSKTGEKHTNVLWLLTSTSSRRSGLCIPKCTPNSVTRSWPRYCLRNTRSSQRRQSWNTFNNSRRRNWSLRRNWLSSGKTTWFSPELQDICCPQKYSNQSPNKVSGKLERSELFPRKLFFGGDKIPWRSWEAPHEWVPEVPPDFWLCRELQDLPLRSTWRRLADSGSTSGRARGRIIRSRLRSCRNGTRWTWITRSRVCLLKSMLLTEREPLRSIRTWTDHQDRCVVSISRHSARRACPGAGAAGSRGRVTRGCGGIWRK